MHAEREGGEDLDLWQYSPLPRSSNLGFLSFLSANKKGAVPWALGGQVVVVEHNEGPERGLGCAVDFYNREGVG
jgi:hypothetical protein